MYGMEALNREIQENTCFGDVCVYENITCLFACNFLLPWAQYACTFTPHYIIADKGPLLATFCHFQ